MANFRLSRLDAYFLTILVGIGNTERVAYDFSNVVRLNMDLRRGL